MCRSRVRARRATSGGRCKWHSLIRLGATHGLPLGAGRGVRGLPRLRPSLMSAAATVRHASVSSVTSLRRSESGNGCVKKSLPPSLPSRPRRPRWSARLQRGRKALPSSPASRKSPFRCLRRSTLPRWQGWWLLPLRRRALRLGGSRLSVPGGKPWRRLRPSGCGGCRNAAVRNGYCC